MSNNDNWTTIENALRMASVIGPLSDCTCDDPLIKWRDNTCGWCQLQEAIQALDALTNNHIEAGTEISISIADATLAVEAWGRWRAAHTADIIKRLTEFRVNVEVETQTTINSIPVDLGLALADVAKVLGIEDPDDLLQVLGPDAYLEVCVESIPYRPVPNYEPAEGPEAFYLPPSDDPVPCQSRIPPHHAIGLLLAKLRDTWTGRWGGKPAGL